MNIDMPVAHMQKIFGMKDSYIKKLERDFHVSVVDRNGHIVISGDEENVTRAAGVLR